MTNPRHIYVQVWTEIDPTLNVRVDRRSGEAHAEDGDLLHRVSPLGRAAVAAALAMSSTRVTVFAIGCGHREALQHGLAAGAAEAVELVSIGREITDVGRALLPARVAATGRSAHPTNATLISRTMLSPAGPSESAVADWLLHRQPDLVIADRMAGLIAGRLGWSHFAGLDDLQFNEHRLQAVRHLGRGEREVVTARLPAVVRLQTELIRPPYISRARIQAASPDEIPCERLTGEELQGIVEIGPFQPTRARTRFGRQARPSSSRGMDRLTALMSAPGVTQQVDGSQPSLADNASAEEMAEEFVRYLMHHDLL